MSRRLRNLLPAQLIISACCWSVMIAKMLGGRSSSAKDHPGNNFGISTNSFNRSAQRAACNPRRLSRGPLGTAVKR
jgi:hypothetical protein